MFQTDADIQDAPPAPAPYTQLPEPTDGLASREERGPALRGPLQLTSTSRRQDFPTPARHRALKRAEARAPRAARSFLHQFMKQFLEFHFCSRQRPPARRGRTIFAPGTAALAFRNRAEIAAFFQAMQQGIHRSGAQLVTMPAQFLHHPEANQRLLRRVMQDMEADKSRQQFQLVRLFWR